MSSSQGKVFAGAAVLLALMAALMLSAASQNSATVDETTVLGAGYTYFKGHRYKIQPEHPPLSQMLPAVPLLFLDVKMSEQARALLEGQVGYPWARPWFGPIRPVQELFPDGRDNWYFWALPESQLFGQMFVYGSENDADAMLFSARCVQIFLALIVGALIFFWVRRATDNNPAAFVALSLWVFNPNAIAYGHLCSTGDIGVTLGMTAATLFFAKFLESPGAKSAICCGIFSGIALLMKFTAVTLAPIFVILAAVSWKNLESSGKNLWKFAAILVGSAWIVVLLMYFPRWSPAPALPEMQADALGVPAWFRAFRFLLIPPDFFKGLALTLGHSKMGHDAFLMGNWSHDGWWHYYPLAFFYKNSLSFVILVVVGVLIFAKHFKQSRPFEFAAWIAPMVYLLAAMTSKVNIGVRHLLPIFPLLCVGIGCAFAKISRDALKQAAFVLLAWQVAVTIFAFPLYIQFFSEAVGGAKNGYKYLLDSNYDWGQDAKRLKQWLDERQVRHIYLDYFGTQYNIEYLKISNTRVNAEQARNIAQGILVVSASQLMRPEWQWLRDSHQPIDRIAHTLFVYQIQPK
jgi:hypothetical protein